MRDKKPYMCTKRKFVSRYCHMRNQLKPEPFKHELRCIEKLMKEAKYKKDVIFFSKRIFCS